MTPSTDPSMPTDTASSTDSAWIPWLLVMLLFSLLVAVCVGFLKRLGGSALVDALLEGGAAFGGSALLCLGVVPVIQQLRRRR
ncbi:MULTISPECIES: hypothetical protein [unclassified Kitasatospora]|uniref:hypothetical protein n=1 Tax=unclassified Kitasatospora TaxID=2633591 RepID=UPI00382C0A5C